MSRQFEFEVERSENLLEGLQQANIHGFNLIKSKSSEIPLICIRHGPNLISYRFDTTSNSWNLYWKENIYGEGENFNTEDYPWFVGDILGTGSDIIIIRNQSALVFLKPSDNPPGTELLTQDTRFGGWSSSTNMLMGHFYSDNSIMGMIFRNSEGDVEIYEIRKDLVSSQRDYPLIIVPNLQLSVSWRKSDTKIFLTDLRREGKDVFVLHTADGLEIYEFDQNYKLKQLMRTKNIKRTIDVGNGNDNLFFGHFTNVSFKDIIHLNDTGLFLYKYDDEVKDFTLVDHNDDFTARYGWRSVFIDSIKIYDINNDGMDDLVFTGPHGLNVYSFNVSSKKWESILNSSHLQGLLRYSRVIGLVKDGNSTFFSQTTNGFFQPMNIIRSKKITVTKDNFLDSKKSRRIRSLEPFEPSKALPSTITRMPHHELPTMRWTEQWDGGFLKEAVRPQTGQVEFSIPLIKAGPIPSLETAIGIAYNSQDASSELLGVGWTIPIADYYIAVDHKGSIYQTDYEYYLIREGRRAKLIFDKVNGKSMEFELQDQPELRVIYDMDAEKWIVGNHIEQITFGMSDDRKAGELKIQLSWSNWKGSGTDTSKLRQYVQNWYLCERRILKSDLSIFYKYETSLASIDGKSYTTSVRLVSISDNKEFAINFGYAAKAEMEYRPLIPIDADKVVLFPIQLVHKHYLKSFNVQTSFYQQIIDFDYQLNNDKRLLVQMNQPIKGHTEAIFKFEYTNELNHFVMSTCKFMDKTMVSFDYAKTTSLVPPFSLQYQVNDRPQIVYGSDYAIMGYKLKVEVSFRLTNAALTIPIFKGSTFQQGSNGIVQSFSIKTYINSFIISQTTGFHLEVFTFSRTDGEWSEVPSIATYHQQSLLCYGKNFYVIDEPYSRKLVIVERDESGSKWNRIEMDIQGDAKVRGWAAQNHMIVGHGDNQLFLYYKNEFNNWMSDVIDRDEIFQITEKSISLFNLDPESEKHILSIYKRERLQMFNNMIAASGVYEENGELTIAVKLYLLDANHKISKTFVEKIRREKLLGVKLVKEVEQTNFTMQYYQSEGKYRMKIVDFSGKLLNEVKQFYNNENARNNAIEERLTALNKLAGWNTFFKHSIIFNPPVYRVQLSKDGLFIGDDIFIRMTGTEWQVQRRSSMDYVRLGDAFILGFDQKEKKSVYLYHQRLDGNTGNLILHIKLNEPGQFINRYPAYLAYHLTKEDVTVLTFKDPKTIGKEVKYSNEELLFESNLTNLMTIAKLDGTGYEWRVRSLANFMEKKFYPVIKKWSITNDGASRSTAYERTSNYKREEGIVEENLRIIPGGSKTMSGWIEHILVNNIETQERNITTNYYSAFGDLVSAKSEKSEDEKKTPKEEDDKKSEIDHQIYDKAGALEISNFFPWKVKDDEGVYFGFESYEDDQGIEYDVNSIVRGKFAFTGDSYLNLERNQKLKKVLQPKNPINIFVASAYIRSNLPMQLDSEVPYLRAVITADRMQPKEILSKVLRQSQEWFYLESYIDLITLNRELGHLQGLQITLEVGLDSANDLDLDHIRFSPLTQKFQATIYHPENGKVMAKITDSGLVSRTIFDRHCREIGEIKSNEQIAHFTRATKTGELVPAPRSAISKQPSSKMKFEPESGFYEYFDTTAFSNRWSVADDKPWSISRGQLIHRGINRNIIAANAHLIDGSSAAIRFGYNIRLLQSSLTLRWSSNMSITLTSLFENQATLTLNANHGTVVDNLPVSGELLIFLEIERVVVWIDGILIIDQGHGYGDLIEPWSDFKFEMVNYLVIEDVFIMNRPRISLEYFNGLSEKIQVLRFVSDKVIQVSQTLYDELGRDVIVTKPTKVTRDTYQPLFAFYPEFVQNDKHTDSNSVWKTGVLKGEVDTLNKNDLGVPFMQTTYDNNPLKEKISEGLPGPSHAVTGPLAKSFSKSSSEGFMSKLFPEGSGYRQQAETLPNGTKKVSVFDVEKNIVAEYTRVAGLNHILSTSEYNYDNLLVKILTPQYHAVAKTASKTTPWKSGNAHLTEAEKKLQETYGTHFVYDDGGRLIEKRTPDAGTIKFMYDYEGKLRFMISMGPYSSVKRVVYFFFDAFGQPVRTGHLSISISLYELQQYLYGDYLPNAVDYQLIQYSDQNKDPTLRGFLKSFKTFSGLEPVQEVIRFNNDYDLSSREIYTFPQKINPNFLPPVSVRKEYNRKQVSALVYPGLYKGRPFKLMYTYDNLGNIIALGTENNYNSFASFTYLINGLVASETHSPNDSFKFSRVYKYNSPGFLEQISDPYLTEDLSYTQGGFGINGFGDGTMLLTTYNAKWVNNIDHRVFLVTSNDGIPDQCLTALKRRGYLDSMNYPIKLFIPAAEISMPLECRGIIGQRMAKVVAEKHITSFYGFRFAYGNYKELIAGKYFSSESLRLIEPLQGQSFSKAIPNLSKEQSYEIFDILSHSKYILNNQRPDRDATIGKRGIPFFRDIDLERELKQLNVNFDVFTPVISSLLTLIISQRKSISLEIFQKQFLKWLNYNNETAGILLRKANDDSRAIFSMLSQKGFLTQMAFKQDFVNVLSKYNDLLPEIVLTLNHHFIHSLGETPFDVEAYNLDSNGNHRNFDTGFERYKLDYSDGTNQIANIKIDDFQGVRSGKTYKMAYDIDGNVVQALHKNIQEIEYNPTSQRITSIRMTNGRILMFYYDAQGERILKKVFSTNGSISTDTYYIRDEIGRVLLERHITYFPAPKSEDIKVTMYIYGPRGLVGFVRNDKFHSIIKDHAGSTRLIIRDGLVVAAFDYLPYGRMMRLYYTNPQDLIAYRYAGQEFDDETGLYSYRTRLYDPEIGRFYQIDPQAQYFSPYKYAGIPPIPAPVPVAIDNEVARTILGISNVILGNDGADLATAANKRWNPIGWDFKDSGTDIGLTNGGVVGALLPTNIDTSIGDVSSGTADLGAGGMYLNANAANGNWNPGDWKWDSPENFNSKFQGFSTGLPVDGGMKSTMTYVSNVMANNGNAAFWQWDLTSPDTWQALLGGFDSGVGTPSSFVDVGRTFEKVAETPDKFKLLLSQMNVTPQTLNNFTEISKDQTHPLYKVAVATVSAYYFIMEKKGDFDDQKHSFGTYNEVFKGTFFGNEMNDILTTSGKKKIPQPEMAQLFPFKQIDTYRARRSAVEPFKFKTNSSTTFIDSSQQVNSMELIRVDENAYYDSMTTTSSGSVSIPFWPLNLFRSIKSKFGLTNRYKIKNKKQTGDSPIPTTSESWQVVNKTLLNPLPYPLPSPELELNDFEDYYSILEMGDQWVANTNIQGNFMLIFIWVRKLFGYKFHKSKSVKSQNTNTIEFGIQAYEIVNNFVEKATTVGISCGVEEAIHKIIESGSLDHLVQAVKIKLIRGQHNDIPVLLNESLIGKFFSKIRKMSSLKQANQYKNLLQKYIFNLNINPSDSCWSDSSGNHIKSFDLHTVSKTANHAHCNTLEIPSTLPAQNILL